MTDWPTTPIRADARGRYTFEFHAPAPHATREWKFYVTREGRQPGSPLHWADLQEFCSLGNVPVDGKTYKLDYPLPKRRRRSGRMPVQSSPAVRWRQAPR